MKIVWKDLGKIEHVFTNSGDNILTVILQLSFNTRILKGEHRQDYLKHEKKPTTTNWKSLKTKQIYNCLKKNYGTFKIVFFFKGK